MKIYIEAIIFINFIVDFILLFGVCLILRRQTNLKKLLLSSLIGSIVVITMFYNIDKIYILIVKLITSFIMVIVCCGFKNITYTIKNVFYLYTLSITLGGSLYLISIDIFNNTITTNNIHIYRTNKENKEHIQ